MGNSMNRKKPGFQGGSVLVFCLMMLSINMFSVDFEAIKNPKPNMVEKNYVALKKIKTLGADLGNGEYLFQPFSLTSDKDSIYVYDLLQAKIFKFDPGLKVVKKSFGKVGTRPGEFGGTGKSYPVFIQLGGDGKIYANDMRMKKIIIFDLDGKYFGEFKDIITNTKTPLVDAAGNLYIVNVKDNAIDVLNEKQSLFFSIANQKDSFNYLFSLPSSSYLTAATKNLARELIISLGPNSTFFTYFPSSATMMMMEKNKKISKIKIWPQEALEYYKGSLKELLEKEKDRYRFMFHKVVFDEDNSEVFFLQSGINIKKGINALYQVDGNGELLKVLYIKVEESSPFTHFELKRHQMFYAIEGDKLIIYKEEIK